jgi:hypothetical protein
MACGGKICCAQCGAVDHHKFMIPSEFYSRAASEEQQRIGIFAVPMKICVVCEKTNREAQGMPSSLESIMEEVRILRNHANSNAVRAQYYKHVTASTMAFGKHFELSNREWRKVLT